MKQKTLMEKAKDAVRELVERPIAARIKAEPGWRAVVFKNVRERDDGLQEFLIEVQPVKHWALDAPAMVPPTPDNRALMLLFGSFDAFISKTPFQLWPIDVVSGKRIGDEIHRLVPPSEETDLQLVEAAKLWCAETVEKNKKPEPPTP